MRVESRSQAGVALEFTLELVLDTSLGFGCIEEEVTLPVVVFDGMGDDLVLLGTLYIAVEHVDGGSTSVDDLGR